MKKQTLREVRLALDAAAIRAVEADQDGSQIEFINEEILKLTAALGRRLLSHQQSRALTERSKGAR